MCLGADAILAMQSLSFSFSTGSCGASLGFPLAIDKAQGVIRVRLDKLEQWGGIAMCSGRRILGRRGAKLKLLTSSIFSFAHF